MTTSEVARNPSISPGLAGRGRRSAGDRPASPLVVAHRGASALAPENTMTAFHRAVAAGAPMVELDVHLSADGRVVVIHDATVDRTAVAGRRSGAVAQLSWAELQEVVLPGGERLATLEEVLAELPTDVGIQVEVKAFAATRPAVELLASSRRERATLISFQLDALRVARETDPELPLGVLTHEISPEILLAVDDLQASTCSVALGALDRAGAGALRARGTRVCAWTAQTEADVVAAVSAGAELVVVDDPAWCRTVLDTLHAAAACANRPLTDLLG